MTLLGTTYNGGELRDAVNYPRTGYLLTKPHARFDDFPFEVIELTDGTFRTTFDWSNPVTGTAMFVNYATGSNSFSGLAMNAPKKDVKGALDAGASVIYVVNSKFDRNGAWDSAAFNWSNYLRDIAIIGIGSQCRVSIAQPSLTWSADGTYSGMYNASITDCGNVFDYTTVDDMGFPVVLQSYASKALLNAATTGYSFSSGTVSVKAGRVISSSDANILACRSSLNMPEYRNPHMLYLANIDFVGWTQGLQLSPTAYTPGCRVIMDNCRLIGASASNNLTLSAAEYVFMRNCNAGYSLTDVFNHHSDTNVSQRTLFMTENCNGIYGGWSGYGVSIGTTNQIWTSHDGSPMIIVGGTGRYPSRQVIANQGTVGDLNYTWAVGVTATDAADTSAGYGFGGIVENAWIYKGTFANNAKGDIAAPGTGTMYVDGPSFTTSSGAIQPYIQERIPF